MHNNTVHYVSAEAQANSIRILQDELTEKETDYFRRGKNSNPHAVSKNANHADYMYATGFEGCSVEIRKAYRLDDPSEPVKIVCQSYDGYVVYVDAEYEVK